MIFTSSQNSTFSLKKNERKHKWDLESLRCYWCYSCNSIQCTVWMVRPYINTWVWMACRVGEGDWGSTISKLSKWCTDENIKKIHTLLCPLSQSRLISFFRWFKKCQTFVNNRFAKWFEIITSIFTTPTPPPLPLINLIEIKAWIYGLPPNCLMLYCFYLYQCPSCECRETISKFHTLSAQLAR